MTDKRGNTYHYEFVFEGERHREARYQDGRKKRLSPASVNREPATLRPKARGTAECDSDAASRGFSYCRMSLCSFTTAQHNTGSGEAGAGVHEIMKLMGHATLSMCQRYVHPQPATRVDAVRRMDALAIGLPDKVPTEDFEGKSMKQQVV